MGILFWLAMFFLCVRLLSYFKEAEIIGDLLLYRFLSMILLVFFFILTISNVISSLSNLLLSKDLEICHSSPSSIEEIFLSRMILTIFDSSWMIVIFGLPVIMAYAWIYHPGIRFYIDLIHTGLSLIIISANLGVLVTIIVANILPAHRIKEILFVVGIFLFVAAYLLFRFMRPERLVNPEAFFTPVQYMKSLRTPDSPYLPSYWMCITLWKDLKASTPPMLNILLLWSTALALTVINIWLAELSYFNAYSKALKSRGSMKVSHRLMNILRTALIKCWGRDRGIIMDKELRTFFRDNTQWTQLILLGALVAVYVYNFKVLPLAQSGLNLLFLQNEIAFFNIGFTGFLLSAISVRFIFPSVSAEGEAFWIVRTSPMSLKRFLWSKFLFYFPFMLLLGEGLIIITNNLLLADMSIMVISVIDMFFMVGCVVSMGIGIGAIYPNFRYENIAQVGTSIGAVIYMILSFLLFSLTILIQAIPVYWIFMSRTKGISLSIVQLSMIAILFSLSFILWGISFFIPIQMGAKRLEEMLA